MQDAQLARSGYASSAGAATSTRESAMMRKSGGAAEAAPEAAIAHFSLALHNIL